MNNTEQRVKDPTLPEDYSPKADNSDIPRFLRLAVCPNAYGQIPDMNKIRQRERENYENYLRNQKKQQEEQQEGQTEQQNE